MPNAVRENSYSGGIGGSDKYMPSAVPRALCVGSEGVCGSYLLHEASLPAPNMARCKLRKVGELWIYSKYHKDAVDLPKKARMFPGGCWTCGSSELVPYVKHC